MKHYGTLSTLDVSRYLSPSPSLDGDIFSVIFARRRGAGGTPRRN
jgi:hypothetical protein